MLIHNQAALTCLAGGPGSAIQLAEYLNVSQPTISRVLKELGDEVVRIGAARSIQYALRDRTRGLPDLSIYRVDTEGKVRKLGVLIPVRPEGFVMQQEDGITLHSEGLPWWLLDMRPQGYLGRIYAERHGAELGLPERLNHWTDTHTLRALMVHGQDVVGNLLLGDMTRDRFLALPSPMPIGMSEKFDTYAQLATEAAHGDIPGSSAGGEQPKFMAFAETTEGPCHVLVKFTEPEQSPVSERWRDLLLVEHLALSALREAGIPAARTQIIDHHNGQRFLEAERFDRIGLLGRRAVFSLTAMDAEFVGAGSDNWAVLTQRLAADRIIHHEAARVVALLWAFGTLIGNTDMHNGNLSFMSEQGRPYQLAPAYDMTAMGFTPRSGGGLPDSLAEAVISASVSNETWRQAEALARVLLARIRSAKGFSQRFASCIDALESHIEIAGEKIDRLG
jgi:hypothetical protein